MYGVCQKPNNESFVMWEEIMWLDQVSHNSERYVCESSTAHTKHQIYSEDSGVIISLWYYSSRNRYLDKAGQKMD